MILTDDQVEALEYAITHIRETYNDTNLWHWTSGGLEMPDNVAEGYQHANVLEDLVMVEDEDKSDE